MPLEYSGMKLERLHKFKMSSFPGNEEQKDKKNLMLGNPVFNYALNKLDCSNSNVVVDAPVSRRIVN